MHGKLHVTEEKTVGEDEVSTNFQYLSGQLYATAINSNAAPQKLPILKPGGWLAAVSEWARWTTFKNVNSEWVSLVVERLGNLKTNMLTIHIHKEESCQNGKNRNIYETSERLLPPMRPMLPKFGGRCHDAAHENPIGSLFNCVLVTPFGVSCPITNKRNFWMVGVKIMWSTRCQLYGPAWADDSLFWPRRRDGSFDSSDWNWSYDSYRFQNVCSTDAEKSPAPPQRGSQFSWKLLEGKETINHGPRII